MNKFLLLIFLVFPFLMVSQTITMSNGDSFQCTGKFYDSGGPTGPYLNNELLTYTICPDTPGQSIRVTFTSFDVENGNDILYVYDGPDNSSTAAGGFTGTTLPGIVTAGPSNTSGCITFVFNSDSTIEMAGWEADVTCVSGCQTITSQIDSSTPARNSDGKILACVGEPISLEGSGNFENSGVGASYEWELGDGRTMDGQDVSFSYDTPGLYLVNLNIRDTNTAIDPEGCQNTNRINQIIQISSNPDFTGTLAEEESLCLGDSTVIRGVVTPVKVESECTPPVSGTTFLPDGTGQTYFTSISVDCFDPGQTIQSANQLLEVCLNIEHAWAGDLEVLLIAPDGRRARLFKNDSFSTEMYLGSPNDNTDTDSPCPQTGPGTGADYCFTMNAQEEIQDGDTVMAGCPQKQSVIPGNYRPLDSFANFIGSPLNGEWTLSITDFLVDDDGYLFEFNMAFDPSIKPAELTFTPTIVSAEWDNDPSITSTNGRDITVTPTTLGQNCYTFRVVDDFGCEYIEEVCVEVFPNVTIAEPTPYEICDDFNENDGFAEFDLNTKDTEILDGQDPSTFNVSYYLSLADANQDTNPLSSPYINVSNPQIIYARVDNPADVEALCYQITELSLLVNLIPETLLPEDVRICVEGNGTEEVDDPILDTGLSTVDYSFEWSLDGDVIPFQTNSSIIATEPGLYTVSVTDRINGCTSSESTTVIESSAPELTASLVTETFADNNIIEAVATGFGEYEYSINDGAFQTSGRFTRVSAGVNTITARDINGCGIASVTVRVVNFPRFFTPNDDGSNDTWNVKGLVSQPNSLISIFDRYGKLIKQIVPNGPGWDGTVNGVRMPSTDYWFSIDFTEPGSGAKSNFKAHFSLLR